MNRNLHQANPSTTSPDVGGNEGSKFPMGNFGKSEN